MIIKPNPDALAQLADAQVAPMMLGRIHRRGTQRQHPSGAQMYTYNGMTMVGDLREGILHVFRFYK